jgi:hypothetical protein
VQLEQEFALDASGQSCGGRSLMVHHSAPIMPRIGTRASRTLQRRQRLGGMLNYYYRATA